MSKEQAARADAPALLIGVGHERSCDGCNIRLA